MKYTHPREVPLADFIQAARQLLPPGDSVSKEEDAAIQKIAAVLGKECCRASQRSAEAMETLNPKTPGEMLTEWLQATGANDGNLVATLTEIAIKNIGDLRALFPLYEIEEVAQMRAGFNVGAELAVNAVRVKFPATPRYFHCGDPCGTPLKRVPGIADVRAAIRRYLPAHIRLNVAVRTTRYLTYDSRPLTLNGRHLTV